MNDAKLESLLRKHEGEKLKMYQDTVGKWTVGVGHNLSDKPISLAASLQILKDDIADTLAFLDKSLPWWRTLDEVRQVALADMAFNLMGRLLGFKHLLAALQSQDWATAYVEALTSTWATQVGSRAKEIATMFKTGQF